MQCGMTSFSPNFFSNQIQCSHAFPIIQFPESSNLKQSYFIADETRDFPCIQVLPENFQSAPPVFWSALMWGISWVPWGMFSTVTDIMSTVGGYLEYCGGYSVPWGISWCTWGISWVPWGNTILCNLSTMGGYHDTCGGISWVPWGCSVPWGYSNNKRFIP